MISDLKERGGRGYAVAVFAVGLGSVVEMTATLGLFWGVLPPIPYGEITTAYFFMLGVIGAAFQGQNFARALPGQRPVPENDERV